MNRIDTSKLLAMLTTLWPNTVVTDETITGWTWALEDTEYEDAVAAAKVLIRTHTGGFLPPPAALLEIIAESHGGLDEWEAAWTELLAVIRAFGVDTAPKSYWDRNGPTEGPVFPGWSSPLVAEAVALVGYRAVCMADEREQATIRAQFRDAYTKARKRQLVKVQTGVVALPGADGPAVLAEAAG